MPSPGMGSQLPCCTAPSSCFLGGGTTARSRTAESSWRLGGERPCRCGCAGCSAEDSSAWAGGRWVMLAMGPRRGRPRRSEGEARSALSLLPGDHGWEGCSQTLMAVAQAAHRAHRAAGAQSAGTTGHLHPHAVPGTCSWCSPAWLQRGQAWGREPGQMLLLLLLPINICRHLMTLAQSTSWRLMASWC